MSCAEDIQKGSIGTVLEVEIVESVLASSGNTCILEVVDVSSATTKEIILQKPDGTAMVKTAEFTVGGVDGLIRYVTIAADMDDVGKWLIQGHVIMPTGEWFSKVGEFNVGGNLPLLVT